ncbi:MAG TPA: thiamine-binding protein [Anaerolineae bacterium]|nr:thiamine-binding protein [Anaerolineae bacterium]
MNPVNVAVEVLPFCDDPYPVVDRAIAVIQKSGVKHEVEPMETVMEGDLDTLLEVAKQAHRAAFVEGVDTVVTFIKIHESRRGVSMEAKVAKYR